MGNLFRKSTFNASYGPPPGTFDNNGYTGEAGSLYYDITNKLLYINNGDQTTPDWIVTGGGGEAAIAWDLFADSDAVSTWRDDGETRIKWCKTGDSDPNNRIAGPASFSGVNYDIASGAYSVEILTPGWYQLNFESVGLTGGLSGIGPDDPLIMTINMYRGNADGDTSGDYLMYGSLNWPYLGVSDDYTVLAQFTEADIASEPFITVDFRTHIRPTGTNRGGLRLDPGTNNGVRFSGFKVG